MSCSQPSWIFQHQIFSLTDERNCVKVSRHSLAPYKAPLRREYHGQQIIEIGSLIIDIVHDSRYKLLFILTEDCKAHAFQCNQIDQKWCFVTTMELSAQHERLRGKAVCTRNHIYWQSCCEGSRHNCSIIDTEFQVSLDVDEGVAAIRASPAVEIFVGCPPCHLYTFGNQTVIALPESARLRSLVISVLVGKLIISHVTRGVVTSCDYLLAPVKFADVALAIVTALKSSDKGECCAIKCVMCDGQKLLMVSSNNHIWELSSTANTFSELDVNVASVPTEVDVWLLGDSLVWLDTEAVNLRCINMSTNTAHSKPISELGDSWCYDIDNRDVLLFAGEYVVSVSQLLDVSGPDIPQTSNHIADEILTPPGCLQSMNDKLLSVLPQMGYSKHLVTSASNQVKIIPTKLSQEMSQLEKEHRRRGAVDKTSSSPPMVVTVIGVTYLLNSVTIDNLSNIVCTLTHLADIAKQTCFNAFNRFLIQQEPAMALHHWRLLFTSADQRVNTPPLVTLYLRLVWQLQPQTIVNAALMVGCKSKECMQTSSAPTMYIDSLLDVIDSTDKDKKKSRLLSYAQLCLLREGCERRKKLADQCLRAPKDTDLS